MRSKRSEEERRSHRAAAMRETAEVLKDIHANAPEAFRQAEVVGVWVWVAFDRKPGKDTRETLYRAGFNWNHKRQVWQCPCGRPRPHLDGDPRAYYGSVQVSDNLIGTDPELDAILGV